jgi:hypothetical protein
VIASDEKEHGFSELADALALQFKLADADRKERRRRLGLKSGRAVNMKGSRSMRNYPTVFLLTSLFFLNLLSHSAAWAEPKAGDTLSQANWQEAKGLMPDPVLRRFQDGKYQAKVITLPDTLGWGSKFKSASEANAGKFSVDAEDSLTDNTTKTYPAFLYGYPFPQVDPKDPHAAAKIMYNFSYTLMQPDDLERSTNLHWLTPSTIERYVEFQGQVLFYGSRFSGPIANPDATLRKLIIAGVTPHDVVGVVTLEWTYLDPKQWNSLWVYVRALRRARQRPPANGSDGLFGSDLAHDDPYLFSGKIQYFTWKFVGAQEALVPYTLPNPKPLQHTRQGYQFDNLQNFLELGWETKGWSGDAWWPTNYALVKRPVWVVEAIAKDPQYAYGRQVLWIDKELYVGYYKEAYDKGGQLWRTQVGSVSVGRSAEGDFSLAQPDFTVSVDEQRNHATVELPLKQPEKVTFNAGLSERIFTQLEMIKRAK